MITLTVLSIVIPVLNEESTIGFLLDTIYKRVNDRDSCEVIVVDGGSEDGTALVVQKKREQHNLRISFLGSPRGRAVQMNLGARQATGEILYFLHADSIPPQNFDKQIIRAIKGLYAGGCFRLRFDNPHPILKISQWFTRFNWKICRGGDQSLFVRRALFESMQGFNESYQVYEDCEFIYRLYGAGKFVVLKDSILTSARKYQKNGVARLQFHFAVIHLKKWLGSSPASLLRYYKHHIIS